MSFYKKPSILHIQNKIQLKRDEKKAIAGNSGNWEYTPYRNISEAKILIDLISPHCFDPKNVTTIRFPPKTKETE